MNILLCGDVVGRPGRDAVKEHLPGLRRDLAIDVSIVNAENSAHGFGLTEKICGELYDSGADVLTTGNHVWDQREIIPYLERDPRVLRPANFPPGTFGSLPAQPGRRPRAACRQSDGPALHGRARRPVPRPRRDHRGSAAR